MTETRPIVLAGSTLDVPALPLRLNMRAYPLCRKLTNDDFLQRIADAKGVLVCTEEEMADLAELAFLAAKAANPALEREAFDGWAVTPPELLDAFFVIRWQTGGWIPAPIASAAPQEGEEEPGEAQGAN